ncbi:MAG: DUF5131 family protein [Caulobacterales bacterium]|nr:DUF5131 family protein [Caulobacterales bacterium]
MGELTSISWCDMTFNPWIGCTKVGPACDGCYAEALFGDTGRFPRVIWGRPGHRATHSRTAASTWAEPRRWNRMAVRDGVRRFVFCASVADVFDNQVSVEWRRDLFDLIRATPNLTWLLLTKRPQNIVKLAYDAMSCPGPSPVDAAFVRMAWPRNAAIGCTVVLQAEADRDVPVLLAAKAAVDPAFAFVSMEPLLGAVNLRKLEVKAPKGGEDDAWAMDALEGRLAPIIRLGIGDWELDGGGRRFGGLDWVISGGETAQGEHQPRPSHPAWFRSLRDQCAAAGVAYHHKQNGEFAQVAVVDPDGLTRGDDIMVWPDGWVGGGTHTQHGGFGSLQRRVGVGLAGRELDGVTHDARPEVRA